MTALLPVARRSVPPIDPKRYAPSVAHPVRAKARHLAAQTRIDPHSHPWGQLAFSMTGVIRMTAGRGTYIVPPSRAVWIPPGVEHVVHVVEDAEIRTLYLHQDASRCGPWPADSADPAWRECRVIEVSSLLRELVTQLTVEPGQPDASERNHHVCALILDELRRATAVRLGVDLPRDKRLLALCEAVLHDPTRWTTLDACARNVGASPRTVARLFRSELGTSFLQWRQQVLLAKALSMAARKVPLGLIAAELGYASASAFTAMVKRSVGAPPSRFFN
jgi:AraC-like DNA-binding protein